MKKYYSLLLLGFCYQLTYAQTNTFPATGNVGIGISNPQEKLNVLVGPGGPSGISGLRIGGLSNYPSLELGIENNYDGVLLVL